MAPGGRGNVSLPCPPNPHRQVAISTWCELAAVVVQLDRLQHQMPHELHALRTAQGQAGNRRNAVRRTGEEGRRTHAVGVSGLGAICTHLAEDRVCSWPHLSLSTPSSRIVSYGVIAAPSATSQICMVRANNSITYRCC